MPDITELLHFQRSFASRRVLVTDRTGFKGSWIGAYRAAIVRP